MSFVYDEAALTNNNKVDIRPRPGPAVNYATAAEWNTQVNAINDIKDAILNISPVAGTLRSLHNDFTGAPDTVYNLNGFGIARVTVLAGNDSIQLEWDDFDVFAVIACPMDIDATAGAFATIMTDAHHCTLSLNVPCTSDMRFTVLRFGA